MTPTQTKIVEATRANLGINTQQLRDLLDLSAGAVRGHIFNLKGHVTVFKPEKNWTRLARLYLTREHSQLIQQEEEAFVSTLERCKQLFTENAYHPFLSAKLISRLAGMEESYLQGRAIKDDEFCKLNKKIFAARTRNTALYRGAYHSMVKLSGKWSERSYRTAPKDIETLRLRCSICKWTLNDLQSHMKKLDEVKAA
ncbi:MAG: hypothetical protein AAF810_01425 [Cyanobacteria bacterium P01_D01_bin.36]